MVKLVEQYQMLHGQLELNHAFIPDIAKVLSKGIAKWLNCSEYFKFFNIPIQTLEDFKV